MTRARKSGRTGPTSSRSDLPHLEGALAESGPPLSVPETNWKQFALLVAAVLVVIASLMYWPLLTGRIPFPAYTVVQFPPWETVRPADVSDPRIAELGDLTTLLYPWRALTHGSIREGEFPLWNPYYQMGLPFFAEPQSALVYPPHVLFAFLPLKIAWGLSFPLRLLMAGMLAAICARALGCTRSGAIAAGVIYALCAQVNAFNGRPQLDAALWLPLMLFSVHRLQSAPRFTSVFLTAAAFSLTVLGGHPENSFHAVAVGCLFAVWRAVFPALDTPRTLQSRFRFLALFTAAGLLAFAFTAVQVLPTLEWLGQINRGLDSLFGPRPLSELIGFFSRDSGDSPNAAGVHSPEGAIYAGILTLILIPLAFISRRLRDLWFIVGIAVLCFGISYGYEPFWWFSQQIPVLKGLPNHRLLIVMAFCIALLAGAGLTALERMKTDQFQLARTILAASSIAVTLGVLALLLRAVPITALPVPWRGSAMSSAVVLAFAAIVLLLRTSGIIDGKRFAAIAIVLLSVDLVTSSYGYVPFNKPGNVFPPNPTFEFLQNADPSRYRAGSVDMAFATNYELVYGLFAPAGFDLPLRRASALLDRVTDGGDAVALRSEKILSEKSRVLDVMNVKYLVTTTGNSGPEALGSLPSRFRLAFSDGPIRVFENLSVLPRAFLVPATGVEIITTEEEQLRRLLDPAFDPSTKVILPEAPSAVALRREASGAGRVPSTVSDIKHSVNRVSITVNATEPGILVLSQMYYPGWQVKVNGSEQNVLRADYAFSAVALAPGRQTVEFVFRPRSIAIGLLISVTALAASIAGLYLERRHRASRVLELDGDRVTA